MCICVGEIGDTVTPRKTNNGGTKAAGAIAKAFLCCFA